MQDFELELPGYLNNFKIVENLKRVLLRSGTEYIAENLRRCYGELVRLDIIPDGELTILDAWLQDVRAFRDSLALTGQTSGLGALGVALANEACVSPTELQAVTDDGSEWRG